VKFFGIITINKVSMLVLIKNQTEQFFSNDYTFSPAVFLASSFKKQLASFGFHSLV